MRWFYSLVILDLAATSPMDVSILRHPAGKIPALSTPAILIIGFALLVANFAITWMVAHQGGILPFLGGGSRRFNIWTAWIAGPLLAAIVPLATGVLIIRLTFD